jgi:hypothetical protein
VIRDRSDPLPPVATDPAAQSQAERLFIRPRRLSWAKLIARVFESEILVCPQCSGEAEVIAAITQPSVIQAILKSLGPLPPSTSDLARTTHPTARGGVLGAPAEERELYCGGDDARQFGELPR